jgi:hypothetical protein
MSTGRQQWTKQVREQRMLWSAFTGGRPEGGGLAHITTGECTVGSAEI